jgi:hypothetical protein
MLVRSLRRAAFAALVLVACGPSDHGGAAPSSTTATAPRAPDAGAFNAHVAHRDPRLGWPSFAWITASGRSSTAKEAASRSRIGLASTFGLDAAALAAIPEAAEIHDTGRGAIVARFRQAVDGVEVFRGGLSIVMSRAFEPVAASGLLAPRLRGREKAWKLRAPEALDRAWARIGAARATFAPLGAADGYERFGSPALYQPARVKKVLFPQKGALEPGYYVEATVSGGGGWSFVVSAQDGRILFENDLVRHDAFSYRVFASSQTKLPMDAPDGNDFIPHPTGHPDGTKLTWVAPELVALENYPFSKNDPWLPVGATSTSVGNNVHAYADLVAPDGLSAGDVVASLTSPGTFDLPYDPTLPPDTSNAQIQGSAAQLFYVTNFLHDWFYDAGFDEISGNPQHDNYGRGGRGNDPILAEAQDYSGRNNSDAQTPGDGSPPRIQMYVFSGTSAASLVVSVPAALAGTKDVGIASWGQDQFDLSGDVVVGDDGQGADARDGCEPITNNVTGKIVLVHRGLCSFVQKAQNVEAAKGIGVLIANVPASAQPTVPPILGGTASNVNIPALGLALADGQALETAALAGTVTVEMKRALQTDLDGAHDTGIVTHEWGHVLSNRLIGDGSGLTTNQAGGLGEGWSDFVALLLTVRPDDDQPSKGPPWSGAFVAGGYAMSGQADLYFGVRRVPYSIDFAKDPLTFKHIQNGVPLPTGVPIAFGEDGSFNSEVHSTGEIWATMLWECYASLLQAHPFADAQDRMKRYLVASMKITPVDPTLLEARDAVLAAAYAADPSDYKLFWAAFARRGAGVGAEGPPKDSASNIGVRESTFVGNDAAVLDAKLADNVVTCDRDGYLDPGEVGTVSVTVRNDGTDVLVAPVASVTSKTPGVTVIESSPIALGSLKPFESKDVQLLIGLRGPKSAENSAVDLDIAVTDATLPNGAVHSTLSTRYASDEAPNASATDDVDTKGTAWKAVASDGGAGTEPWARKYEGTNGWWAVTDPTSVSDQYLTSPVFTIDGTTFKLSFRHRWSMRYSTRRGTDIDGGVVEVSVDRGKTWTDIQQYGAIDYNSVLDTGGRGDNPLKGQHAFGNKSPGYPDQWVTSSVAATLPAHPDAVQIRFHLGSGTGFSDAPGWEIDNIALDGIASTPFWAFVPHEDLCDPNAPIVDPGPNRTVPARTNVTLNGSAEAVNADATLVYTWRQESGPMVEATGADTSSLAFVAPDVPVPTVLTFTLRADDGKLVSPAAPVEVTVMPFSAKLSAYGGCDVARAPGGSGSRAPWMPGAAGVGLALLAIAARRYDRPR